MSQPDTAWPGARGNAQAGKLTNGLVLLKPASSSHPAGHCKGVPDAGDLEV